MFRRLVGVAGLLLLAGCAHGGARPADLQPATPAEAPQVKAGDRVALKIFGEPEMSDNFLVASDGTVILPKLGVVPVRGRSIVELQDSLRRAFAVYLRNPSIDVTVLRRVSVEGAVRNPGVYMVDLTMTLRDVIAAAGGITEAGDPNRVRIARDDQMIRIGGQAQSARFSAAQLESGDLILVGERNWFERNSLAIAGTASAVVPTMLLLLQRLGVIH